MAPHFGKMHGCAIGWSRPEATIVRWHYLPQRLLAVQINAGMMRALEAFQEAILMVDATDGECWRVLHVNRTFSEQTGMSTP